MSGTRDAFRAAARSAVVLVLFVLAASSCLRVDPLVFNPDRVDEYLRPEDMLADWEVEFIIPDSLILPVELVSSGGKRIYGFLARHAPDTACGYDSIVTVLYCHGNSANINRYWGRVELLWRMGFHVFIFDYQGYGRSEGEPSGDACYADGRAALAWCRTRPDIAPDRIVYYGWSLGAFVACQLAADSVHPLGLVLETPLASVSAAAREGVLFDLPGSFFTDADFDNERRIRSVGCPLLMLYGTEDVGADYEWHTRVLAERAQGHLPVIDVVGVQGAGHSDIPAALGFAAYDSLLTGFTRRCLDR